MVVKLQTTAYPIFSNLKIVLGLLGGFRTETKNMPVTWNTGQTTVTGARLVLILECDQPYTTSEVLIRLNAQEIFRVTDMGRSVQKSIDVIGNLQNGVNTISVQCYKIIGGATFTVTISLEVDFQGTPPSIKPTIGGIPLDTVLLVGGGVFFIIVLGIVLGGRRR